MRSVLSCTFLHGRTRDQTINFHAFFPLSRVWTLLWFFLAPQFYFHLRLVGRLVGWLVSMEYLPSVYPSTDSINSVVYMSNGVRCICAWCIYANEYSLSLCLPHWLTGSFAHPPDCCFLQHTTHNILDHKRD